MTPVAEAPLDLMGYEKKRCAAASRSDGKTKGLPQ